MTPLRASTVALACCLLGLAGCRQDTPQALGTLEYDRVTLPAPSAEKIVRIDVREGQRVAAGAPLLGLEAARTRSQFDAAQAQTQQARERLQELEAGPRSEDIAQARAALSAAQAQARDAQAYYTRLQPLARQRLVAAADLDRARATAGNAEAQVRAAQAALLELERGTRSEQIAQGASAVAAAQADARAQAVTLQKLDVVAPRAGRIDAIPYKLGDQAPIGAPLVVMLVGDAPYARVYIPEPLRAGVEVGARAQVFVDGRAGALSGRVRMIRSEPSYTPYYALVGKDASRLSWLAEIQLDQGAQDLPAGLPVRVEFSGSDAR